MSEDLNASQDAAGTVITSDNSTNAAEEGKVTGIPDDYNPEVGEGLPPENSEAGWKWREGMPGEGKKPDWVMDKYGSVEDQAKANVEAQKYIGQLQQQLGVHKGAPKEYDFSEVETDGFQFDHQDPIFNEYVTMARNENVSQEYMTKTLKLARKLLETPDVNMKEEIKAYGENYEQDEAQIANWVINNNTEELAQSLMSEITSAKSLRALKNLMNSTGISIPTQHEPVQKETVQDLQRHLRENMYEGENYAKNPDKAREITKKFKDFVG